MTTQRITEALFERGTLVDLHIGKPTFQKKLRQNDILANNIDANVIYLGHKKLLPPSAMERLNALEGRARAALAAKSLAFPVSGTRFVNVSTLPDVLRSLTELRGTWNDEVAALVVKYPGLKDKQLEELDKQSQKLMEAELQKYSGTERDKKEAALTTWLSQQKYENKLLYPSPEHLSSHFKFAWRMFRISPTEGLEQLSSLTQEELANAQEQLKRDLKSWVREASADLHRALGAAAAHSAALLKEHGKLTPRNLKPLFDAFETFKAVDFTGTSDFRRVIDNIRSQFVQVNQDGSVDYDRTAIAVNGSDVGKEAFNDLIKNVATLAEEQAADEAGLKAIAQTGEFGRAIEI